MKKATLKTKKIVTVKDLTINELAQAINHPDMQIRYDAKEELKARARCFDLRNALKHFNLNIEVKKFY